MTTQELIVRTKELLPPGLSAVIPDAMILRHLNYAYDNIAMLTYILRTNFSVAVSSQTVPFPSYVLAILSARWTDGTAKSDLIPIYWSEAISFLGSGIFDPPSGTPKHLIVFSPRQVTLYPKPSIVSTVEGIAAVKPDPTGNITPLTSGTDEPKFVATEHDALAYYAAASILMPYPEHANYQKSLMQVYYEKVARIKENADDFTMRPVQLYPPIMSGTGMVIGNIVG